MAQAMTVCAGLLHACEQQERRERILSNKETFLKGTLILAAALVARVLGLVQRVPLEHLLGSVGNASFTIANNAYLMLLTVATAGIPSTLSKMVSERYALDRPSEARRVYRAALIFAVMGRHYHYSAAVFWSALFCRACSRGSAIRFGHSGFGASITAVPCHCYDAWILPRAR